jgi:hypothetical protein
VLSAFRPATEGVALLMLFSTDGGLTYASTGYNHASVVVVEFAQHKASIIGDDRSAFRPTVTKVDPIGCATAAATRWSNES